MVSAHGEGKASRPRAHLLAAGKRYPKAWKGAEAMWADKGRGLPDWPEWCLLPLAAWYALVGDEEGRMPIDQASDIGCMGALGTWRYTQSVYRFDSELFKAITETPVTGDLPVDALTHLPEWCVYIETPGLKFNNQALAGFFAHLESDVNTGRMELRLALDMNVNDTIALWPVPIHVTGGLENGMRAAIDEAQRQAWKKHMPVESPREMHVSELAPLVSLVLYLCSEAPDIDGRPGNPEPKRTRKHGWKLFPAANPRTWDVGQRIGAALRSAYAKQPGSGGGEHAGPRPHIRRAHWHTYRIGEGRAESIIKWLPPIPINVDSPDDLPTTVRPVP